MTMLNVSMLGPLSRNLVSLILVLAAFLFVVWYRGGRSAFKKPPGPPGLPLIGNLFDLPGRERDWLVYSEWAKLYGDITSLTIGPQYIIFLHKADDVMNLFVSRSAKYMDRPVSTFGGIMCGWIKSTVMAPYGPTWKDHRKILQKFMGTKKLVEPFEPVMRKSARLLVRNMLSERLPGQRLEDHIRIAVGASLLGLVYSYEISDPLGNTVDRLVYLSDLVLKQFSICLQPGVFLADAIPLVRFWPSWMPGGEFRKTADYFKSSLETFAHEPYEFAKKKNSIDPDDTSFVATRLRALDSPSQTEEEDVKWSAASMVSGGTEALVSMMIIFVLAMTKYPAVQRRAQDEIDRVIGKEHVPVWADRERLPYVSAIYLETLRWQPAAFTNPRRVMEDDTYEGYHIPKDTIVIANVWHITHDPRLYVDPFKFNPDRFMGADPEQDPSEFAFGFSRRICPGNHFAAQYLFISIVTWLCAVDVRKAQDADGQDIEPSEEVISAFISRMAPFEFATSPRAGWEARLAESTKTL